MELTTDVFKKENNILKVPSFDIPNGISTRMGGVSNGYFSTMNLGLSTTDSKEHIRENFRRFCKETNTNYNNLVLTDQTHNTNIKIITKEDAGKGLIKQLDYNDIDGLITNEKDLPISVVFADCLPVLFYDKKRKVIGVAHSGWKGTEGNISKKMIETFKTQYNSDPKDILVCIGPSIMECCYEVDDTVADKFQKDYPEYITKKENDKYMLSLQDICKKQLLNCDIEKENITVTDLCTMCNKDHLFSHRGSSGKRGLGCAILSL